MSESEGSEIMDCEDAEKTEKKQ